MPELPEVENFRKYFEENSLNKKIVRTEVNAPEMLKGTELSDIIKFTEGYKFVSSMRHGKYFFAQLSSGKFLVLHFGMTGYFIYYRLPEESTPFIRLQFKFSDGSYLAYDNMRKFGLMALTDNPEEYIRNKKLGIDPLNTKLTPDNFVKIVKSKTGTMKSILMDQSIFAGIGNLYSDEIVFQAGIHPSASLNSISLQKKKDIYKKMMSVLRTAVKRGEDIESMPRKYLIRFRKDGSKCPLCGGKITHKTIAGRTSYFCSRHQKK